MKKIFLILILLILVAGCIEIDGQIQDVITVDNEILELAFYGDKIAWAEESPQYGTDIYLYDISNKGEPEKIGNVANFVTIGMRGNKVAWGTGTGNRLSIRAYDMSTEKFFPVPSISGASEMYMDIENNRIAELRVNGIYWYSLSDLNRTQITDDDVRKYCLAMNGNNIVWRQNPAYDTSEIYLYDIESGEGSAISTESGMGSISFNTNCPKVRGNFVAYPKKSEEFESSAIYLYDIEKKKETKLTDVETEPVMGNENGRIIWELQLSDEKIMYTKHFTYWYGPDMSAELNKCYVVDIDSGKKTEIDDAVFVDGWPYCGELYDSKVAKFNRTSEGYKIYLIEVE